MGETAVTMAGNVPYDRARLSLSCLRMEADQS